MTQLVVVGPLHWATGHEHALRALRALLDGGLDVRLDVLGEGPAEEQVRFSVADLGLAGAVHLERGGRRRLRRRLAAADALVLPALDDRPWPRVLDAVAAGVPVVAYDRPWLRRSVPPERLVPVPVRDADALTEALRRLCRAGAAR